MHRSTFGPTEVWRPCVFCDESVLQAQGFIATNRDLGYSKTGMAHEHCLAAYRMRQLNVNIQSVSS